MSLIKTLLDLALHLDKHLTWVVEKFGLWAYLILFIVIFVETGLVLAPFLPGDSLLFTAGAFAAIGAFNIWFLFGLLCLAAVLGDSANYAIGHFLGNKILNINSKVITKIIKREYLEKTQSFYNKHGAKTIVIARFVPIIRTFAPFLAGIGKMRYFIFLSYNIIGGILWVAVFLFGGFFFGNIPFVKENFTVCVITIILLSFIPVIIEAVKHYNDKKKKNKNKI